ncbi:MULTISPECIES: hypothetical protein [unclassified Bradyrhizobium]|uniref:hypothetical protein n=1 Tax=unclassified Bradyrhizobium TaxID=2631580 RepID=UPI0029171383|nr:MULTISPECIES: hypothetical protein [unclassified Bradyrhizobium]
MEPRRHRSFVIAAHAIRCIAVAASVALAHGNTASAQAPRGIYAPGQAVVTGFSGGLRPFEIEPGQDADAHSFLNPDGSSLRVVDLSRMGAPPEAQLVGAPKPFTVSAKWIGQVFGVALDDQSPANIYVAATSAYGLSIVAPGADGKPQHIRYGTNNAAFMPAQWGPGGGPGSIWKIDGLTGEVKLFANVVTGGRTNSGAALGGLAYDPATKSLFVADRETGLIHRFGMNGTDLGAYDHGVSGTAAIGLAPVPAAAGPGIDLASPQFDSAGPETWEYTAPERRVFGLAIRDHRLYYAVADGLRVWSVGLDADGSFGSDIRIEVAAPPAAGPTEISRITFDDAGRMYLAERPAPTGAQDFEALSVPSIGRVLRYTVIGVTEAKQPIWQAVPDEYAVGFPETFRNDNGGVAIGYSYDDRGNINPRSCGGFVWTTGEQLRNATDPKAAAQLGQPDMLAIDGLQGNPAWRIRRDHEPPRLSYFIDYADAPPDLSARGHLGDIAILRTCADQPAQLQPGILPFGVPLPPPSFRACQTHVCGPPGWPVCPVNQVWSKGACAPGCAQSEILIGGKCCSSADLRPGGACSSGGSSIPSTDIAKPMCGTTQTAIGPNQECCNNDHIYSGPGGGQLCCLSALVNGVCEPSIPKIPNGTCTDCCSPGYVKIAGKCCLKSQATSKGVCCPAGQSPSADGTQCQPTFKIPKISLCCVAGYVPTAAGKCCATANLTTSGECCPAPVNPKDRSQCIAPAQKKFVPQEPCRVGEVRDDKGACVARKPAAVPIVPGPVRRQPSTPKVPEKRAPERRAPSITGPITCPPGMVPGPLGKRCWPIARGRIAPLAPRRLAPPLLERRPLGGLSGGR